VGPIASFGPGAAMTPVGQFDKAAMHAFAARAHCGPGENPRSNIALLSPREWSVGIYNLGWGVVCPIGGALILLALPPSIGYKMALTALVGRFGGYNETESHNFFTRTGAFDPDHGRRHVSRKCVGGLGRQRDV